jgi:MFS family permease
LSREAVTLERPPANSIWENRPFIRLWSAQAISQTAQNAIWFALMVLIEEATHSTTQIGLAIVSFILPSVIFTVPAGVLVDRTDKRLVLISTNWLRAFVVLGYLVFGGSVVAVFAVTFVFSVISQFFLPAEAAMIPTLVGRERLITANSLFNLTFTISQLVGIVFMAPIIIKFFGTGPLFLVIAFLFALCGGLVFTLPSRSRVHMEGMAEEEIEAVRRFFSDLRETWHFLITDRVATVAMVVLTSGATLTLITAMLAPRFVVTVLGIGADNTVFILAPAGLGMALGALLIGRLTRLASKELLIVAGLGGVALGMGLLAVVSPVWNLAFVPTLEMVANSQALPGIVSLVVAVMVIASVTGFALSLVLIPSQTILQEQAPPASRGRIFAVQIMLGNLASLLPLVFVGGLADFIGVPWVLGLLALVMFALGWVAFRAYRPRIWGGPAAPAA